MKFTIIINWTGPLSLEGLLGCIFHFYLNSNRTFGKKRVETLIGRRVLWHLFWVFTVCLCPTKRTLGLNGLMQLINIRGFFYNRIVLDFLYVSCSLITRGLLDIIISRLITSEISIFCLVPVAEQPAEQAGLNLTLSNDRFLMSRPILYA